MTITEAARALGLSRSRIYQFLRDGRLVRAQTAGGKLIVDATSIELLRNARGRT